MELTLESLIAEPGLELASGHESASAHVRWVHSRDFSNARDRIEFLLALCGRELTR